MIASRACMFTWLRYTATSSSSVPYVLLAAESYEKLPGINGSVEQAMMQLHTRATSRFEGGIHPRLPTASMYSFTAT